MKGIAIRRHHRERLINKWKNSFVEWHRVSAVRLATTHTPCSCYMCGNPRKYFKEKTIQERRNNPTGLDYDRDLEIVDDIIFTDAIDYSGYWEDMETSDYLQSNWVRAEGDELFA